MLDGKVRASKDKCLEVPQLGLPAGDQEKG